MYAIKRLQHDKGTWYWVVNFNRRGLRYQRRFYEPMHGGSKAALAAAIAWRDEKLAQTQALSLTQFCQQKRSNNTSGVAGVHFLTSMRQPEGIWQAKLKIAGKAKHKSFSVKKHGAERAYQLAVQAREQMLAQAHDRLYLYHPVARRKAPATRSK